MCVHQMAVGCVGVSGKGGGTYLRHPHVPHIERHSRQLAEDDVVDAHHSPC